MKGTLTILVLLSSYIGLAQNLSKEYSTELYSIRYPEEWTLSEDHSMGAVIHILSPKKGESDTFNENVNLLVQDLTGTNLNLDGYVQLSENQITEMIPNGKIARSERLGSGSLEIHKIIYSGEFNGIRLKLIQHYQIRESQAYIITFTAEEKVFDEYKEFGQLILNSFRWK